MKKKANEPFTLEENLALTNEELKSNITKLSSLIRSYEKTTWVQAQRKAAELLREKQADYYIDSIRMEVFENQPKQYAPIIRFTPETKVFELNYQRLLKLAPGIEEKIRLFTSKKIDRLQGSSDLLGMMTFFIKLIKVTERGGFFEITYTIVEQGKLRSGPRVEIRIDTDNKIVEALSFKDDVLYRQVYDDLYNPTIEYEKEKKGLNEYLSKHFEDLIKLKHVVKWENSKNEAGDSFIIDTYRDDPEPEEPDTNENPAPVIELHPKPEPDIVVEKEVKNDTEKNEKMSENKTEQKKVDPDKLASIVSDLHPELNQEKAEEKAGELIIDGKVTEYLFQAYDKMQNRRLDELFECNYQRLLEIIPGLMKRLINADIRVRFVPSEGTKLPAYEIALGGSLNKATRQFAIYEKDGDTDAGTMMFAVSGKMKTAWLTVVSEKFDSHPDYFHDPGDPDTEKSYQANRFLDQWIWKIANDYGIRWSDEESAISRIAPMSEPTIPEQVNPVIPPAEPQEPKAESNLQKSAKQLRREKLSKEMENARKIPHFMPGKVKLTEAHKNAGVTQEQIDWINKNKQGMVLTLRPRSKPMINNTKSKVMDRVIQAEKPGFRISKTGQLYYEGRSNRSDKGDKGI